MFKYIVLGTALLLAFCAALFSITGIVSLFAGAMVSVGLMACAIELGKLTTISLLYRHWHDLSKSLRRYLIAALFLASVITTLGIYGYLSSAYASVASTIQTSENQITLTNSQQKSLSEQIKRQSDRIQQLQSFRGQQENRLDKLVGHKGLRDQQTSIINADKQIQALQNDLTRLSNRRDSLEAVKTQLHSGITANGHLGSFYYIAQALNVKLDTVAKYFILIIVLVFDPLSISLLLSYNIIARKETKPEPVEGTSEIAEPELEQNTPTSYQYSEHQLKAGVVNT